MVGGGYKKHQQSLWTVEKDTDFGDDLIKKVFVWMLIKDLVELIIKIN